MKVLSVAAAGITLALIVLTLTPASAEYRSYFAGGALLCSAVTLVTIIMGRNEPPAGAFVSLPAERPSGAPVRASSAAQSGGTEAAGPSPVSVVAPASSAVSGEAQVVGLLAVFQEQGRLMDFLQDDITGYSDAQVGAAARVVHQGCKAALDAYFRIAPVREESEGAKVTVPAGYLADEYRLVGKIDGQAPFSGTLMHRGWKAQSVTLPRILRPADDRFPTIAPAEVEVR